MPRAGWVKPQDDQRLSDHVALGLLTRTFPPQLVDAVVAAAGREQQRSRLLPARLVVYYVLAMALFSQAGYEEVMRNLVEGLSWESGWRRKWTVPSKSAIFQARARLGAAPLEALFERGCVPLATPDTPGAFYRDWRVRRGQRHAAALEQRLQRRGPQPRAGLEDRRLARHRPLATPARLPRQPLHQVAHHLLVARLGEQRHRQHVIDDQPRRQQPRPLLLPARCGDHRIHQLRRKRARQQPKGHMVRQPLVVLRFHPPGSRHTTRITQLSL